MSGWQRPGGGAHALRRRLSGPVPRLGRAAIVAQAVAALAFVVILLSAEGVRLPFTGGGDWTVTAVFSDAGGIHSGESTPVLVAGVPEGQVTSVVVRGGRAVVSMRLDGAARGVIRRDAGARIEPRSALEDMTIDITPGSSDQPAAGDGTRIPIARTAPTTTLDRVTAVMDTDTRAQLSIVLGQLARGMRGQSGRLQSAVLQLQGELDPATQVLDALAQRRTVLAQFVGSLSRVATAAQRRDAAIASSLSSGAVTLGALAQRESSLSTAVGALPSTMTRVRGALGGVRSLAQPLLPALRGVEPLAGALPGTLASVRQTMAPVSRLLRGAQTFATRGSAGLASAASLLGSLGPTARALVPAIQRVAPVVSAVNSRRAGIAQLGERFSGVLSTDDANGPILRGLGTFEPFNPADFGFPSASPARRAALASQAATALTLACLHGQTVACLVRYLVPGLPGSVR
jgi:phospholipid/cholesterol/gamma-HCH transport system substrate-binding protein